MPKCDFNEVASNFIEVTLRHGCSPVNLLHIFRTFFLKNTSEWLFLSVAFKGTAFGKKINLPFWKA